VPTQNVASSTVQKYGISPLLHSAQEGTRSVLTVHGFPVAAIVSLEDLRQLEDWEAEVPEAD
jgi:prevent-host-death family protein